MAGLKALFPWPHFIALGLAVWAGYKFYFWFIDYEFKRPKNQNWTAPQFRWLLSASHIAWADSARRR